MSSLQQKFTQLLTQLTSFFAAEDHNPDHDRQAIEQLYRSALDLAAEAKDPVLFQRFLAYLLGVTNIEALYPLQSIRMIGLVQQSLMVRALNPGEMENYIAAALLADIGFRAVWLGQRNIHADLSVYRIRTLGFSWWNPMVERLILFHHEPQQDPSPFHLFSIVSFYLGQTYGTGIDYNPAELSLPARTIELLMQSKELDSEGRKTFIRAISAYPLGSWVQLNTGDKGFVVQSNLENPLRPVVCILQEGHPYGLKRTALTCAEIDLKKDITKFIAGTITPTQDYLTVLNSPAQWIPRWDTAATSSEPVDSASPAPSIHSVADIPTTEQLKTMVTHKEIALTAQDFVPIREAASPASSRPATTNPQTKPTFTELLTSTFGTEAVPSGKEPIPAPSPTPMVSAPNAEALYQNLIKDIQETQEKCSMALLAAKARTPDTTDIKEKITNAENNYEAIRKLCRHLAAEGDIEAETIYGILLTWSTQTDEISAEIDRLPADLAQAASVWEQKKKDIEQTLGQLEKAKSSSGPEAFHTLLMQTQGRWEGTLKADLDRTTQQTLANWTEKFAAFQKHRDTLQTILDLTQQMSQLIQNKLCWLHLTKGIRLKENQAYTEAIHSFQQVLTLNPHHWEAHAYIGLCYLQQRDRRAIDAFQKALHLQARHPQLEACLKLAQEIPN